MYTKAYGKIYSFRSFNTYSVFIVGIKINLDFNVFSTECSLIYVETGALKTIRDDVN